jgi:5-(carboxyamino)imidazole ribonucleotide synthase
MFAISARRMGYRVHTFSPDRDSPTGQIADVEIDAPYEDLDRVRAFAAAVDVVTFEFENVPAATAEAAAQWALVRPAGGVLHTTQHRLREKTFLRDHGFPVTRFEAIRNAEDLTEIGPAILKTAGFGYDGKGQYRVTTLAEVEAAWNAMGREEAVLEALVDFEAELSVIGVRGANGECLFYAPSWNQHVAGILDVSSASPTAPGPFDERVAKEAVAITRGLLEALDVTGVLCVEFFLTRDGRLLVNELAPRPHNSGHLTIDACVTSQFEQQLRSVCGLPLGSTYMLRPAAMANLLGDIWAAGEPDWVAGCSAPEVKLHLYGKLAPRAGRKMGHLTATAATAADAEKAVRAARARLI